MPWSQAAPDEPRRYLLSNKEGHDVERNPDKLKSFQRLIVIDDMCLMEVTGEGVLVFREYQRRYDTNITVRLYTWDEIRYDPTPIP